MLSDNFNINPLHSCGGLLFVTDEWVSYLECKVLTLSRAKFFFSLNDALIPWHKNIEIYLKISKFSSSSTCKKKIIKNSVATFIFMDYLGDKRINHRPTKCCVPSKSHYYMQIIKKMDFQELRHFSNKYSFWQKSMLE